MPDERPKEIDKTPEKHVAEHDFEGGLKKNGTDVLTAASQTPQTDADHVSRLVDSPNGHVVNAVLDDGESAEITVPVADGETVKVYRWGCYKVADGTTPAGLDVELKDGSDTVVADENTADTESTDPAAPVVSDSNDSGGLSIYKFAVANDTGGTISDPGAGGFVAYVVE